MAKINQQKVYRLFFIMTQVFIAALSTDNIDLNDEELQYHRDQKARQIVEVRESFQQLYQFSCLSKKERGTYNTCLLWKNLLILSKILGYQQMFESIDRLNLPHNSITQQLLQHQNIFVFNSYPPKAIIGKIDAFSEKYIILMEGVAERQYNRSSFSKFQRQSNGDCSQIGSKFKRSNKRRFTRNSDQIPICLNSKRSQNRIQQKCTGAFRSISEVQIMQISLTAWKKYVSEFKSIEQHSIMSFIRKNLSMDLKLDLKTELSQNMEENTTIIERESFYDIELIKQKEVIPLNQNSLILQYSGSTLIQHPLYKIQASKGCVLNPGLIYMIQKSQYLQSIEVPEIDDMGVAIAKTDSILIKLKISNLVYYCKDHLEDFCALQQLLENLQESRKNKRELQKICFNKSYGSLKLRGDTSLIDNKNIIVLDEKPKNKKRIHLKTEGSLLKLKEKKSLFQFKDIEDRVQKTLRAAELKSHNIEIKNKVNKLPSSDKIKTQNNLQKMPEPLFKDYINNIQTRYQLLKKMMKSNRKRDITNRKLNNVHAYNKMKSRKQFSPSQISVFALKKKIRQIHVKTEDDEKLIEYYNFLTERSETDEDNFRQFFKQHQKSGTLALGTYEDKQMPMSYQKWFGGGLGVMKKVQSGQIRRMRVR